MKTFVIISCLFLINSFAFSEQPAPLGKLLGKRYPALQDADRSLVLISFKDKGNTERFSSAAARSFVSERSLHRRMKVRKAAKLIDEQDYPLEQSYVEVVAKNVTSFRHQLKWFNAVSAIATKQQIEILRHLSFVKEIELIGRWKKKTGDEQESQLKEEPVEPPRTQTTGLDYGTSLTQVNQINVPAVHNLGIYGQGVIVGVFDNGVRLQTHEAFASMNIIAQHDFVDHKDSVVPNNTNPGFGSHGVNTLSTIGGYKPGQLIGPAFKSSFILARTENDSSETPIEEDNWAAAAEWADSIGVDVTSTSLGYLTYDAPYTSWTWMDMDGNTTLITQAADHAASIGIVVVNSAGNDASRNDPNTLVAPADGFDVITVGAVSSSGVRASFSSYGPTFDNRTKPDVMAMGVSVKVASSTSTTGYGFANGTSFSCPLTAGVAALLVCANDQLSPSDIADALRQTASNADAPDNFMGWGVINALDAIHYNLIIPIGRIQGKKFNDLNGNGILDAGEPGLAGVKIRLTGAAIESTLTDALGNYKFDSLAIGSYTVSEVVPSGWIQSSPITSYNVSLLHGTDTSGLNFGNFQLGVIHGITFNDLDSNGTKGISEPGLQGWRIRVTGPVTVTTTTDTNGSYWFMNLPMGTYTVSESAKAGWLQSLPANNGSYTVIMTSNLDTAGLDFGNYYSPLNNYHVLDGWNLLSLPNGVSDPRKTSIYPAAISNAFKYAGSYQTIDTILNGIGYWLKFGSAQNIHIPGTARSNDSITVNTGWNMIGSLSDAIATSSLQSIPGGIVTSNYFFYDGAYHIADSLEPHEGYWVKVNAIGKLVLSGIANPGENIRNLEQGKKNAEQQQLLSALNSLTFEDAFNHQETLYFGKNHNNGSTSNELYELPPAPPGGSFDVRFASQQMVTLIDNGSEKEFPILLSADSPSLTIRWKTINSQEQFLLTIDGKSFSLNNDGSAHISQPISHITLSLSAISSISAPKSFSLGQNYPNPFNPTTNFGFRISEFGVVTLKIYDVLGREVATLVNESLHPGVYKRTWDASKATSGVYYYKLRAGNFSETKKMLLMK